MKKTQRSTLSSNSSLWKVNLWLSVLAVTFGFQLPSQAAKILYVQTQGQRDTAKCVNILRAQGHEVVVLDTTSGGNAATAAAYQSQGFQLLIADEVIGSGSVGGSWRNSPLPVVTWEAFIYNGNRSSFNADTGLIGGNYPDVATANAVNGGLGADFGQIMGETSITITAPGHPLAAGLSGTVQVWNTGIDTNKFPVQPETNPNGNWQGVASFIGTRTLVPGITKIAEVPGGSNYWCMFCVEPGVILTGGVTNQARWIHLPWNDTMEGRVMQEPSFFLFEAAVAYALGLNQPTKIRNLTESAVFAPTNTLISFSVDKTTGGGSGVATGGISMKINGANVPGLVITDGGTQWNVSYTNGFAPNSLHTVVASATAADGGTSARLMRLDTFSTNNFTVEAEDYNYTDTTNMISGLFFDNPILCTTIGGGTPDCYFDRVSSNAMDRVKGNTRLTITTPFTAALTEVYRFGPGFTREETMDTTVSWDWAVQARAERVLSGIADYEVRNIGLNDWQNYTRTYPTGKFNIYLRMQAAGTNVSVQLDAMSSPVPPTSTNKLGRFVSTGVNGGELVVLTDDSGTTPIVVELTNTAPSTLRLTALTAGWHNEGYFFMVPSTAAVNEPPSASIDSPADRANVSEGDIVNIAVTATDDGSISNVAFYVNDVLVNTDSSAPYSYNWAVPSPGAIRTDYTLKAVVRDVGNLTGDAQITVFAADPGISRLIPDADASFTETNANVLDTGGGGASSLAARTATNTVNEVSAIRFDLTGMDVDSAQELSLNLINQRVNASGRTLHFYGVEDGALGGDNNGKTPGWTDDTWDEADTNNLAFSTMPGLVFDGVASLDSQGINTNDTVDLGTASLNPTAKDSLFTFTSPALVSFLQNHPDALVTILIATDNDSTGQLRFASKDQSSLDGGTPTGAEGDFAPFLSFRAAPPVLNFSKIGNSITFTWTGAYKLQSQTNALNAGLGGSPWGDYPDGTNGVVVPIDQTKGTVFFRLAPQ